MKVKVLRSYIDKETKEVVKKGTVIADMSEERFEEITKATGYLEKMDAAEPNEESVGQEVAEEMQVESTEQAVVEETQNESDEPADEESTLNEMSIAELKELAKEKGIPAYSKLKKAELIEALEQ